MHNNLLSRWPDLQHHLLDPTSPLSALLPPNYNNCFVFLSSVGTAIQGQNTHTYVHIYFLFSQNLAEITKKSKENANIVPFLPPIQALPKTINIDRFSELQYSAVFGVDTKVFAMLLDAIESSLKVPKKARRMDKLACTLMFLKIGVTFSALSGIFGVHYTTMSGRDKQ